MLKMYFIINTFYRSKKVLLDFPLNEKNSSKGLLSNEALTEVFCCEGKCKHIMDIVIGDYRYLSFPNELDNKKYFSGKMLLNDEEEENLKNIEKKKRIVKLKMFNIVLVFDKNFTSLSTRLESLYKILESFCKFLQLYLFL